MTTFTALVCVAPTCLPASEAPAHAFEVAASDDKTADEKGACERVDSWGSVEICTAGGFAASDINGEDGAEVVLAGVTNCLEEVGTFLADCSVPVITLAS